MTREDRLVVCFLLAVVLALVLATCAMTRPMEYRYTYTCQPGYYEG